MLRSLLHSGGIPSICSAHPAVLHEALRSREGSAEDPPAVLVESTCNQVNQYGGYTGMTPAQFVAYVQGIAQECGFPAGRLLLGGDHLGPSVWQKEPAGSAMQKSEELLRAYVRAGYTKIHLDCSMRLGDDPPGRLAPQVAARRSAHLAQVAEESSAEIFPAGGPSYVVGAEVPVPGGAAAHEEEVQISRVDDVRETIDLHQQAFFDLGLQQAWERVIAVVVQPGVEFGDDFVLPYQPEKARDLAAFIAGQELVYEAHSTDYQTRSALRDLVRDRFAILKVGPGLTFAYREALFSLVRMEQELIPPGEQSDLIGVLEQVMLRRPDNWQKYYRGSPSEQSFKRKYSLSDRVRYYWVEPEVQQAVDRLMQNLSDRELPWSLAGQFASLDRDLLAREGLPLTAGNIVRCHISRVLDDYRAACA